MRLALVLIAASLAACVVQERDRFGGGNPPITTSHTLRFEVLLDGVPCEDVPEVRRVRVRIDDPFRGPIEADVSCPASGELIYVPRLAPGTYPWKLSALDAFGGVLYEAADTVDVVRGSPLVTADLQPVDGAWGRLLLRWSFGRDRLRCAQVGVVDVQVKIGETTLTVPCSPESVHEGVAFDVPPGEYRWTLSARGSEEDVIWLAAGSFAIEDAEVIEIETQLMPHVQPPDPGSILVTWTLNGSRNCAASFEVQHVYVQLWSGSRALLGPDERGFRAPCAGRTLQIKPVPPGAYTLDLRGVGVLRDGTEDLRWQMLGVPVEVASDEETEVEVDLQRP